MIVTTTKKLSANERTEITESEVGCAIHYVGPLLDAADAPRAGVLNKGPDKTCQSTSAETNDVLSRLQEASRVGRQVVLASMGTVTTGNHRTLGWNGRPIDTLGNQYGLTGAQMARAVWGGLFDAVGTTGADEGPLLIVVLGPQPDALGDLQAPANAVLAPSVPQLDVLKAGNVMFLTHGGQNSFMEALLRVYQSLCAQRPGTSLTMHARLRIWE